MTIRSTPSKRSKNAKKTKHVFFGQSATLEDLTLMLQLDLWMGDEESFRKRLAQAFQAVEYPVRSSSESTASTRRRSLH